VCFLWVWNLVSQLISKVIQSRILKRMFEPDERGNDRKLEKIT